MQAPPWAPLSDIILATGPPPTALMAAWLRLLRRLEVGLRYAVQWVFAPPSLDFEG